MNVLPAPRARLIRRPTSARSTLLGAVLLMTVAVSSCGSSEPTSTPPSTSVAVEASSRPAASEPRATTTAATDTTDSTVTTGSTDTTDSTDSTDTTGASTTAPRPPRGQIGALPDGPITVVTLGDSLTEGMGDDGGTGYPGRLPDLLASRGRPGSKVVNVGHSGWDTQMLIDGAEDKPSELAEARTAIEQAKASGRPVVALVLIGSNDLWYLYEYGPEAGTDAEAERADLAHYRANLDTIVANLRTWGAQVVLAINDDQSRRAIAKDETMRAAALPATTNAEVGQMSAQARRYAEAVRQVANDHGILVADFLESPIYTNPATMAEDGNHPNASGYDQLAKDWIEAMGPLLG